MAITDTFYNEIDIDTTIIGTDEVELVSGVLFKVSVTGMSAYIRSYITTTADAGMSYYYNIYYTHPTLHSTTLLKSLYLTGSQSAYVDTTSINSLSDGAIEFSIKLQPAADTSAIIVRDLIVQTYNV